MYTYGMGFKSFVELIKEGNASDYKFSGAMALRTV